MPSVSEEKKVYEARVNRLVDTYSKVYFVGVNNVTSQQMHAVRRALRGKGEMLMGKNTLQKKILANRANKSDASENDKKVYDRFVRGGLISGNCGLIFTNEGQEIIRDIIQNNRVQAPARVGAISPVDVTVPAGNTGLEPTTTSFFQALNIQTKISRGTVEIIADHKVLSVGDKVDNSTASLLTKLKINPFFYGLSLQSVWDDGVVFSAEDLEFTDEKIAALFSEAASTMCAMSLGSGVPTEASFPFLMVDAFKNLLAASIATNFEFADFNGAQLKSDIKEGKFAAAAAPAGGAAAAPAAAQEESEEEEEDDMGMGGLF